MLTAPVPSLYLESTPVDVFQLRSHIVDTYAAYTTSFLNIADLDMRSYVQERLEAGELWPDALIQLSPAYAADQTVAQLAQSQVLDPRCGAIFGRKEGETFTPLRLYHHQRDAINLAHQRQHYVVTTGTGSGKSLTYLVPIVDHILRDEPERGQVRAIIVYPMNALINSQEIGINAFLDNLPPEERHLVRCGATPARRARARSARSRRTRRTSC